MRELWVVKWRDKSTGAQGQSPPFHKKVIEPMVVSMNRQYPDIEHWAAPLDSHVIECGAEKGTEVEKQ